MQLVLASSCSRSTRLQREREESDLTKVVESVFLCLATLKRTLRSSSLQRALSPSAGVIALAATLIRSLRSRTMVGCFSSFRHNSYAF